MVDSVLFPAIREAIKQNELGNTSPYCLSYARLGASGASFGIFQGDTNVNHLARATLVQILQGCNTPEQTLTRILSAISCACPDGNPLSTADTILANDALSSALGRPTVDQMDQKLLDIVLGELDLCITAAATRTLLIDHKALLYIALWVNMTGTPSSLCRWLAGAQEAGLAPPVGPVVTLQNIENYLQANTYFRLHPNNFIHMQDSVGAALALLPPQ